MTNGNDDEKEPKKYEGPDFDLVGPTKHLEGDDDDDQKEKERQRAREQLKQLNKGRSESDSGPAPPPRDLGDGWGSAPPAHEVAQQTGPDSFDILYGVLFEPGKTFQRLRRKPPIGLAILSFFMASLVSNWGAMVQLPKVQADLSKIFGPEVAQLVSDIGPAVFVMGLFTGAIWWFVVTALYHFVAGFFGGEGTAAALFAAIGLAYLPRIFVAPALVVDRYVPFDLASVVSTLIFFWVLYLLYMAIRKIEDVSFGGALVSLLTPIGLVIGFVLVAVVFVAMAASGAGGIPTAPPF